MIKHHFFGTFIEQQVVIERPGEDLFWLPGNRYWEQIGLGAGLDLEDRLAGSGYGTRIAELPKEDFGLPMRANTPVWGACPPTTTNKARAAERSVPIVPPGGFHKCYGQDVVCHEGCIPVISGLLNNVELELVAVVTGQVHMNGAEVLGYAQGIDFAKSGMSHDRGKLSPPDDFASLTCWKEIAAIGHTLIRPTPEESSPPGDWLMEMNTPQSWQDEESNNPFNQQKTITDYAKNGPVIAGYATVGTSHWGPRAIMLGMALTKNVASGNIKCGQDRVRCSVTGLGELNVGFGERRFTQDELQFLETYGTFSV